MNAALITLLLAIVVGAVWLGCLGFSRLRAPLDRLHCVSFVNVVGGAALTVTAFLADGASTRAFKILLITLVSVGFGAALSHAVGRSLWTRSKAIEAGSEAP